MCDDQSKYRGLVLIRSEDNCRIYALGDQQREQQRTSKRKGERIENKIETEMCVCERESARMMRVAVRS